MSIELKAKYTCASLNVLLFPSIESGNKNTQILLIQRLRCCSCSRISDGGAVVALFTVHSTGSRNSNSSITAELELMASLFQSDIYSCTERDR